MAGGTTTTTENKQGSPYPQAKPLINGVLKDATRAYNNGVGSQTFTGSTVVPMARQTTSAYNGMTNSANANINGRGMSGNLQDILNQGGFNDYQKNALNQFQNTANSSYDMNANPGFADVLAKAQNDARNQVGMTASANGRYGSGIAQGAVAREIGNTDARMIGDNYNQWLGRKDAANQNLFNAAQAGIGNMSSAYGAMQDPLKTKLGVGAGYEDLYKRTLDDRLRVFNDQQNAPWNQMSRAMGLANGTSPYGSSNVTSTAPGPNPFLSGLGTVATGAGLLGTLFGTGGAGGSAGGGYL